MIGNPVRRGRMVLSDLDQLKKNERDRRRRLRLEQVRQQSREISNRLLERAKKIAREELSKLDKDGKSELRQMHDRKIMDIQRKYQEDLEDIGQAHASATMQLIPNAIIEEEERRDRIMALKRGKDAMERMKETKQTDVEAAHEERLRKVREMENVRAAMIAKLPKLSEENDRIKKNLFHSVNKVFIHEALTPKRKNKKVLSRKSPRRIKKHNSKELEKTLSPKPGLSGLQKKPAVQSHELSSREKTDKHTSDYMGHVIDDASDDQVPRKTVPIMSTIPTKSDKIKRYNPEDYTQGISDSSVSSSSNSNSTSDSSYFSDVMEQITCNKTSKTPVLTENKVRPQCDHNMRQRCIYDKPRPMVERIDIKSEPNAIEVAQAMKNVENVGMHMYRSRKLNVERRGEDAILREKVRRDYQTLLQNLDHLAQEERKLKASQIQPAEEDTYMRLCQRNKCQEEHQRKLNQAAKKVFGTADTSTRHALTERVITLPTKKKDSMHDDVPHSTWQDPHLIEKEDVCCTQRDKDSEMSRNEQILDMLKKIERQKRLLLREFGASLPDDILSVSMKPLFEDKTPTKAPEADAAKPLSPEIKVINFSSSAECVRKDCKAKKLDKLPVEKIEIAVQTALEETSPADKSVQVELSEEDVPVPHSSRNAQISHPLEPKVIIITPEADDSSNDSTSSETSGMVIEIDKKEVIVTPKKEKKSVRVSKRSSPRVYQKIHLTSKATSSMKKFSKSQSRCRLTPQKQKTKYFDAPDTATRKVDVHMSKSIEVDGETDPLQETIVSIDASAESSQTFSGLNDQDQSLSKPYQVQTHTKRWIRVKDTSTDTSFASLPPIKPKSMFDASINVTPILEMLGSTAAEELRLQEDISGVSTPTTPSPRTMMMPSNIPHLDTIRRMLKFNSNDSQINDSTMISSPQIDKSTPSDVCQQKPEPSKRISAISQQPSSKICICKNPQCKLLHIKLDDIHDYALKNCPEILQKYEDLQNLCTERIASLTDLIEKVRNEQKDIDFSLISASDDTCHGFMHSSTSKAASDDNQAVRKLIDRIEAIHAQLAKTLLESQGIMRGTEAASKDETSCDVEIPSTSRSKLVDTVKTHVQESKVVEGKAKPKIISNEKVNVQFNRFKMQQKPQAMLAAKTMERNSWPPCTLPLNEEEIIEKLSKEILEQSKNLEKTSTAFTALKKNNETEPLVSSFKDLNLKKSVSLEHEKDSSLTKEFTSIPETAKENGFISILTGVPKILRNHGNVASISTRPKPPVTLLNGLYRPELESSGHELSTIVEFDTTDAINKSSKSPAKSKPSVHVAPLPIQQNQNSSKKSTDLSSGIKHSAEKLLFAQKSQETTTICNSPEKFKNMADGIAETKIEAEREYMLEKCNKQLQCNTTTEEPVSQAKLSSSISTDLNNPCKESKHKTTSTSVYSFSGLSGISEITSSPSSDVLKHTSSPEEMETALKKLGLGWAVTTLKKTREASALSSSSNSDVTPINTARRMISPTKKHHDSNGFPDISDVSSISIKEASKSTEQAVLLKGRTSTPKFQNSNSNSERSSTTNTSESVQDPSDSLTVPNMSLIKSKSDNKQLQSP